MCSAQREIFTITCVFDINQFDNMLQLVFNQSYRGTRHYQRELSNLPAILPGIYLLKVSNKTLQQGAKYVES